MTFIVSPKGVKNTKGTSAKFGGGGTVQVGGDFKNTGDVEVDVRANLKITGNVVNSGNFHLKDYVAQEQYRLVENTIRELEGDPKELLQTSYNSLRSGENKKADSNFRKFVNYIKDHPELVTGAVQILLQGITLK